MDSRFYIQLTNKKFYEEFVSPLPSNSSIYNVRHASRNQSIQNGNPFVIKFLNTESADQKYAKFD
jgi:hypothetical protein